MLIFKAIGDMIKSWIIGIIQIILIYIILHIPFNLNGYLSELLNSDTILAIITILIALFYYGTIIKYMPKFLGYIRLKSYLANYIFLAFLVILFGIAMSTFVARQFGLISQQSERELSLLDFSLMLTLVMYFATLAIMGFRLVTRKYIFRNSMKGKINKDGDEGFSKQELEELKAKLSPAAMKMYEKKDGDNSNQD